MRAQQGRNNGFTLIEGIVIVLLIGLFAAIATPSFVGWFNNRKVDDVLAQLEGALRDAQSAAIRQGRACTVNLGLMVTGNWDGSTDSCLTTGPRDLTKLGLSVFRSRVAPAASANTSNSQLFTTRNQIQFSARGTTIADALVIVYRNPPRSAPRCLVVSNGLGIMRLGNYTQTVDLEPPINPADIDASDCQTD